MPTFNENEKNTAYLQTVYLINRQACDLRNRFNGYSQFFHLPCILSALFKTSFCATFKSSLLSFRIYIVAEYHDIVEMLVIGRTFRLVHAVYRKLFLNFLHTWCLCTLGHISRIQIVCPFLYGVLRHTVEVVHLHYIILWIKVAYYINIEIFSVKLQLFTIKSLPLQLIIFNHLMTENGRYR